MIEASVAALARPLHRHSPGDRLALSTRNEEHDLVLRKAPTIIGTT